MTAQLTSPHLTSGGAILPAAIVGDHVDALMELSAAAYAPHASESGRERLQKAVARVLRMFRLHGLAAVPLMSRPEAAETFRQALRIAIQSRVPRTELVAIFNDEEGEMS